jgi:hypothetical protein
MSTPNEAIADKATSDLLIETDIPTNQVKKAKTIILAAIEEANKPLRRKLKEQKDVSEALAERIAVYTL